MMYWFIVAALGCAALVALAWVKGNADVGESGFRWVVVFAVSAFGGLLMSLGAFVAHTVTK